MFPGIGSRVEESACYRGTFGTSVCGQISSMMRLATLTLICRVLGRHTVSKTRFSIDECGGELFRDSNRGGISIGVFWKKN